MKSRKYKVSYGHYLKSCNTPRKTNLPNKAPKRVRHKKEEESFLEKEWKDFNQSYNVEVRWWVILIYVAAAAFMVPPGWIKFFILLALLFFIPRRVEK